jgi:hypothetical protein
MYGIYMKVTRMHVDAQHRGGRDVTQSAEVIGLSENAAIEVRIHTKNAQTGGYDPVGSQILIVTPRGDRADFALDLQGARAGGFATVAPASNSQQRDTLRLETVTVEAWVRFAPPSSVGMMGVAGNAYSFVEQSDASYGAGHFGYGLYCTTSQQSVGILSTRCGFHIGTRTDPSGRLSLLDLCSSLRFENAAFCGGNPGWTTSQRVQSPSAMLPNTWHHLAGAYDASTGTLTLTVNGLLAAQTLLNYTRIDGSLAYHQIYYVGEKGAYPSSTAYPWDRTDFAMGRMLMGTRAATVATAPFAYFDGVIDEVRVWTVARSAADIYATAYRDTVAVSSSPSLLAYFPFDDPIALRVCADEVITVHNAAASTSRAVATALTYALLQPSALSTTAPQLIVSAMPMDVAPAFGISTPADNASMTVHVGENATVEVRAIDENPSDVIRMTLELPSDPLQHPTGARYVDASATGGLFYWAPTQRDAGKTVPVCFKITSTMSNPRDSRRAGTAADVRRCITIHVPLCKYMARSGDTIRSIAALFNTNWRTLYVINPNILRPSDVTAGTVIRIGRAYMLRDGEPLASLVDRAVVSWTSLVNNNAAWLYRLATDQNLVQATSSTSAPIVSFLFLFFVSFFFELALL